MAMAMAMGELGRVRFYLFENEPNWKGEMIVLMPIFLE